MHEQQIQMITRPRNASDLDGRRTRDVDIVQTRGGTATHLAFFGSAGKLTFCGNPVAGPSPAWFQLNGCKKCAKSASKHNVRWVTDTDGKLLELPGITAVESVQLPENS